MKIELYTWSLFLFSFQEQILFVAFIELFYSNMAEVDRQILTLTMYRQNCSKLTEHSYLKLQIWSWELF